MEYENRLEMLKQQVETQSSNTTNEPTASEKVLPVIEWTEEIEQLARWVWVKWRSFQFTSLRDDLWGNAMFLKEANSISVELKKQVVFQFALLTDTLFSPLPADLLPPNFRKQKRPHNKTIVAVKVFDHKNGATHYWSLNKLKQRLELMRKMCEQVCQFPIESPSTPKTSKDPFKDRLAWLKTIGRNFPTPSFHLSCIQNDPNDLTPNNTPLNSPVPNSRLPGATQTFPSSASESNFLQVQSSSKIAQSVNNSPLSPLAGVTKSSSMSDLDYESAIYALLSQQDPFYDRTPWFNIVGRGFVYLSNLLVPVPLVHKMSVVSECGEVRGFLRVAIQPILDSKNYRNEGWNNASIQYTSRRQSATTFIKFDEPYEQSEEVIFEADEDLINDDENVRVVEGRGDSSADNSICESTSKESELKVVEEFAVDSENNDKDLKPNSKFLSILNHLEIGSEFQFRITILDAVGISTTYANIFCQFNFLNRREESFSTEPLKNTGIGAPLGFYHVQNVSVKVTQQFVDFIRNHPLVFEIFGHFSEHPLNDESVDDTGLIYGRRPSQISLTPLSKPVPICPNEKELPNNCLISHTRSTYDLMVWVEICELETHGDYTPVSVEHNGDISSNSGIFLLHQGIQRRIAVTVVHEHASDLIWKDVKEVVVGRIRTKRSVDENSQSTDNTLSLSLFPGHYVYPPVDDRISYGRDTRTFYRFESSWDSSLHNSILLNRVTPSNDKIYVTLTMYLEVDNCVHPVVISKDLCLRVCNRDAKLSGSRTFRNLFGNANRSTDSNRVTGVYELSLKYNNLRIGSPGMQRRRRRVVDTSSTYVRGEENLSGWRPGGDNLILEHQWKLARFEKILEVEKTRHLLLLQDTLISEQSASGRKYEPEGREPIEEEEISTTRGVGSSYSEFNLNADMCSGKVNGVAIHGRVHRSMTTECVGGEYMHDNGEKEKKLLVKCIKLMKHRIPNIFDRPAINVTNELSKDSGLNLDGSYIGSNPKIVQSNSIIFNNDSFDNSSVMNDRTSLHSHLRSLSPFSSSYTTPTASGATTPEYEEPVVYPRLLPFVTEIRVSPVVSRRGYLKLLEPGTLCWMKRWVVVRRPYVFLYNNHKDPIERGLFNLTTTVVECSHNDQHPQHQHCLHTFAVCAQNRGFVLQAANDVDMHGWLYAFNPLLAGSARSKLSRNSPPNSDDST